MDHKYLKNIKPLPADLFKKIRKEGVRTGSKVFGGWTEKSDIDYIMPIGFSPNWSDGIHSEIYCLCDEYDLEAFKFRSANAKTENGTIINLLCPKTEKEYRIWVEATEAMKSLIEQNDTIADVS